MSIYDTLNEQQQAAVYHDKGPLLILAGAGSGKTRVITHRIAYLIEERDVNPYQIMAITFTNKAAKEMRDRVDKLIGFGAESIWVSTFHSSCVRMLRRFGDRIGFDERFSIYDTDDTKSVIKDILKRENIDPKKFKEKSFMNAISTAKNELISAEEFTLQAGRDYTLAMQARVYTEYQKVLATNNALDFDDLLMKTVELFRANPEALRFYQKRFAYIMVDEYQDTNTAQFEFIRLLASHENEDGVIEHNLCVVGDDDQSIYKFRGANVRNILDFEKHFPEAITIKLEQNYRSTGNILNAANEVIANNLGRKEKSLWTESEDGEPIHYTQYDTDREGARQITDEIASSVESGKEQYQNYAILYRTNAQSRIFEEQMIYRGVPYKLVGGVNFYQRKEIKDLLCYLKTVDNGQDGQAVKRILNVPRRGIGDTTIGHVDDYAFRKALTFYEALQHVDSISAIRRSGEKITSFVAFIEGLRNNCRNQNYSIKHLIEDILEATDYINDLRTSDPDSADDRIANINELITKAVTFEEENLGEDNSLSAFLAEVALVADIDSVNADTDCVILMTLHSAKGLEFDHVYLCGMEENVFPGMMSIMADNPELEIEEERRLCYVGFTRARKTLHLSSCRSRMLRGETQYNKPSRFINEIPRHLLSQSATSKANSYMSNPTTTRGTDLYTFLHQAQKKKLNNNPYATEKSSPTPPSTTANHSSNPSQGLGYDIGDAVRHVKFGVGTVTNIQKGGADYEVTVEFAAGTKKMLASFAKLTKIS